MISAGRCPMGEIADLGESHTSDVARCPDHRREHDMRNRTPRHPYRQFEMVGTTTRPTVTHGGHT